MGEMMLYFGNPRIHQIVFELTNLEMGEHKLYIMKKTIRRIASDSVGWGPRGTSKQYIIEGPAIG